MNDKLFLKLYIAWFAVFFALGGLSVHYYENPILDFAEQAWWVVLIAIVVADRGPNFKTNRNQKGKKNDDCNAKI